MFEPWLPIDRRRVDPSGIVEGEVVGSVLLADVYGSARMARTLIDRRGALRGPEELSWRTQAMMEPVVASVHAGGGVVLSFAGAAAVAFFPGDDGQRAVAAGLQAQSARGDRSEGLGLTIGVAAGPVVRGMVGDPSRLSFDVVLGAPVVEVSHAEACARDGEVVVSASVMATCGDRLTPGPTRASGRVIRGVDDPTPSPAWPRPGSLPTEVVSPWVLEAVRDRLVTDGRYLLSELRLHATVFVGLLTADEVSEASLHTLARLDSRLRTMQQRLAQRGGQVVSVVGDRRGFYVCGGFGAPMARLDDPLQAVDAALAMRTLVEQGVEVPLPVGLAVDRAWAGAFGSKARCQYTVLGEGVITAARMLHQASPGEALAVRSVVEAVPGVRTRRLPPRRLKGHVEPVGVWRLEGWLTTLDDQRPFVGRRAERLTLDGALATVREGRGRTVLIEGEAGVGKSRLLSSFLEASVDVPTLVVTAQGVTSERPFHAWREPLRALIPEVAAGDRDRWLEVFGEDADFVPLLGPVLDETWSSTSETQRVDDAARAPTRRRLVATLLSAILGDGPVVLAVEDAHWLDSASADLLAAVREAFPAWMVVATARPWTRAPENDPLAALRGRPDTVELTLRGLDPDALGQLVQARLGAVPDAALRRWLLSRTDGHPYYADELVRWMLERALIAARDGVVTAIQPLEAATTDLPPRTIEGLLGERIDSLAPREQTAVKVASVLGRQVWWPLVQHLMTAVSNAVEGEAREALDLLQRDGIVQPEGPAEEERWVFRHVLLRDAAYRRLPEAWRRTLHAKAASWLSTHRDVTRDGLTSVIASHWERAQEPGRAVAYLDQAADIALRQGAWREALEFSARAEALDPADDPRVRSRRREREGRALFALGALDRSRMALEGALEAVGHGVPQTSLGVTVMAGRALVRQAWHRWFGVVRTQPERAWAAWEADLLNELSPIYYLAQSPGRLVLAIVSALNLAEEAGDVAPGPPVRVEGFGSMTVLLQAFRMTWIAHRYRERALREARALGDPVALSRVLSDVGLFLTSIGRLSEAVARFDEAVALQDRVARTRRFEGMAGLRAGALAQCARYAEAVEMWRSALESAQARGDQPSIRQAVVGLVDNLVRGGAGDVLDHADDLMEPLGPIPNDAVPAARVQERVARARLALRRKRLSRAQDELEDALRTLASHRAVAGYSAGAYAGVSEGWLDLLELSGEIAVKPAVEQTLRSLARFARVFPVVEAQLAMGRGRLALATGRPERAASHLRRARTLATERGQRGVAAWSAWHLARCVDDPDEQVALLEQARRELTDAEAWGDLEMIRRMESSHPR